MPCIPNIQVTKAGARVEVKQPSTEQKLAESWTCVVDEAPGGLPSNATVYGKHTQGAPDTLTIPDPDATLAGNTTDGAFDFIVQPGGAFHAPGACRKARAFYLALHPDVPDGTTVNCHIIYS